MSKITMTVEFATMEEARRFFTQVPALVGGAVEVPQPKPAEIKVTPVAPLPEAGAVGSPTAPSLSSGAATASSASSAAPDYLTDARRAMSACVGRFPSGAGATKVREILAAHGLAKVADVKPEQATALINAFNTAA